MSEVAHATAVLVGAHGILIRGPSGAGKSMLAAALIRIGARLIADDTVHLSGLGHRLVATQIGTFAGEMELRGRGIVAVPAERSAVIRLVADLVDPETLERMPEDSAFWTELLGIRLPRAPAPARSGLAFGLVECALDRLSPDWRRGLRSA